jgi:K+-sensing histidine kinase KdpD
MSVAVAAAVKIASPDQETVITAAALHAQQRGVPCFVISIVPSLPYGAIDDGARQRIERNLALITARNASPVMQEGDDVARCLRLVAEKFGVETLFIQNGRRRFGRTLAEKLIHLKPPFHVVVVNREE